MEVNADVHRQIALFFSHRLSVSVASIDADLLQAGFLDSLSIVELLLYLEESFGARVSILDKDIDDFRTIARIARLVDQDSSTN